MKQFVYIFLLAAVTQGCSDSQATDEQESKTTANTEKTADDRRSHAIEEGTSDVDVDTLGMAEFLALKGVVAAKYRQVNGLTDENDVDIDTSGFTAFKRSKAKTARRPCDCEDSIKAKGKKNSGDSKTSTAEKSKQKGDSSDETESLDQEEVVEDSTKVSRNL